MSSQGKNSKPKQEKTAPSEVAQVLHHWLKTGGVSAVVLLLGLAGGWLWAVKLNSFIPVKSVAPWVQLVSGAFFLWCVLGLVGWNIQTWAGDTPAERLNAFLLKAINVIAMFALFSSSSALIWV